MKSYFALHIVEILISLGYVLPICYFYKLGTQNLEWQIILGLDLKVESLKFEVLKFCLLENLMQSKNVPNFSIKRWKKGLLGNFWIARIIISKKGLKCTVVIWFRRSHKSFILKNFKIRFARDLIQGNSLGFFSDPILGPFARIFFIFPISFLGKWQTRSRFFLLTQT